MKISTPNSQLAEIPDDMLLSAYLHEITGQITAIFGVYCALIGRLTLGWVLNTSGSRLFIVELFWINLVFSASVRGASLVGVWQFSLHLWLSSRFSSVMNIDSSAENGMVQKLKPRKWLWFMRKLICKVKFLSWIISIDLTKVYTVTDLTSILDPRILQ